MRITFEQAFDLIANDELFRDFLDGIAHKLGAKGYAAGWSGGNQIDHMFIIKNDWSNAMIDSYFSDFAANDPWALALMRLSPTGSFLNMSDLVSSGDFEKSTLYNDLLKKGGDDSFHAIGNCLALPDGGVAGLTFYRGRKQRAFDFETTNILNNDGSALAKLMALKASMNITALENATWRTLADVLSVPVLVLDLRRKIVSSNAAAEKILQVARGLASRQGRLACTAQKKQRELEAICRAVQHETIESVRDFSVLCGETIQRFTVLAAPNPGGGQRIVLIGDDPQLLSVGTLELLQIRYGLSPAEAEVMVGLANGNSVAEIVRQRTVSVETVRTQYRSATMKMGCQSVTESIIAVRRMPVVGLV